MNRPSQEALHDVRPSTLARAREAEVLNISEAAVYLRAHEQTVRKLARRGAIPAFKVGRDWRFRKEALLRWSEEQQRGGGRCLVLVVDDDEVICRTIGRVLESHGCRVRHATCGMDGLASVHQEKPDLILLDLVLPDTNGPQFLEKLRKTHPDLPVVIITGYADSELMQEAVQYAPVMLLRKPVECELLVRTVRTVLGESMVATLEGTKR